MTRDELRALVERTMARHPVPGAVAGVFRDGRVTTAAAGVADLLTGEPMRTETGFLTGSITKVWAAVLALTLVDEGRLRLDAPVVRYLPSLKFGRDPSYRSAVTVRQLLDHSSGVDSGDLLVDTGRYPEAVDDYLALLSQLEHLHAPGRWASYNNAGWLVLEAVLRSITGSTFVELLHERVVEPLGAGRTVHAWAHSAPDRMAVGHFPTEDGPGFRRTDALLMPECLAAAGTTLVTTVADTLSLLAMQLGGGRLGAGRAVLTSDSIAVLHRPSSTEPTGPSSGFALGWRYIERSAGRVLWHGGGSNGGYAVAVLEPATATGYVAYANSSHAAPFHAELADALLGDASPLSAGDDTRAVPGTPPADVGGLYSRQSCRIRVVQEDRTRLRVTVDSVESEWTGAHRYRNGNPTSFVATMTTPVTAVSTGPVLAGAPATLTFLEPDARGRASLVYMERRLAARVDE